MPRNSPPVVCPIAGSLELIGEKWTLLILRDLHRGLHRFNQLEENLGCPRNLLSARLRKLTEAGIITRRPYREPGQRARSSYALSDSGRDLILVLGALQDWGLRHVPGTRATAAPPFHADCGSPVRVTLTCTDGHDVPVEELSTYSAGASTGDSVTTMPSESA